MKDIFKIKSRKDHRPWRPHLPKSSTVSPVKIVIDDTCPEDQCIHCFDRGKNVEADGYSGDGLCRECEVERAWDRRTNYE